eukprot:4272611-Prymnesium_polylepis.2
MELRGEEQAPVLQLTHPGWDRDRVRARVHHRVVEDGELPQQQNKHCPQVQHARQPLVHDPRHEVPKEEHEGHRADQGINVPHVVARDGLGGIGVMLLEAVSQRPDRGQQVRCTVLVVEEHMQDGKVHICESIRSGQCKERPADAGPILERHQRRRSDERGCHRPGMLHRSDEIPRHFGAPRLCGSQLVLSCARASMMAKPSDCDLARNTC